jgi:hypothetical protein
MERGLHREGGRDQICAVNEVEAGCARPSLRRHCRGDERRGDLAWAWTGRALTLSGFTPAARSMPAKNAGLFTQDFA